MSNLDISHAQRLDQKVIELIPRLSRGFAARLIEDGKVKVDNKVIQKPGYKLKAGETVDIEFDESQLNAIPEIEIPILYEDNDCIVINKPVGILTHSKGALNLEATVATWLRSRIVPGSMPAGERAGIVHRLDRATSGVMITAKTSAALAWLQRQFSQRKVKKTYYALVKGMVPHEHALIDMPIERNPHKPQTFRAHVGGKPAVTEYFVREHNESYTLLELQPRTGRTHQLRVHLNAIGHPIVGDSVYGGEPADRLYLHAEQLEITLPNRERKAFKAPLPAAFLAKVAS